MKGHTPLTLYVLYNVLTGDISEVKIKKTLPKILDFHMLHKPWKQNNFGSGAEACEFFLGTETALVHIIKHDAGAQESKRHRSGDSKLLHHASLA